jgi:hypothetical protein
MSFIEADHVNDAFIKHNYGLAHLVHNRKKTNYVLTEQKTDLIGLKTIT